MTSRKDSVLHTAALYRGQREVTDTFSYSAAGVLVQVQVRLSLKLDRAEGRRGWRVHGAAVEGLG